VCTKIALKANNVPLGKTFKSSSGQSICIVLTKPQWNRSKGYLTVLQDAAVKTVEATRISAVNNPTHRDTIQNTRIS
jgi:hypothetical protein